MRESPDIETSSDDYARRFSGPSGKYLLSMQREAILQVLSKPFGDTILDVGGGHGQLVPIFRELGCDITVFGSSDICPERIRHEPNSHKLRYLAGNLLNLPFADQSFDLVISVRLISHIENWERLIEELCRVARNSVVLDYPTLFSLNAFTPLLFLLKKRFEGNTRTYTSFFKHELAKEFGRHGFAVSACAKQFFLPMFLHRAFKGASVMRAMEGVCRTARLTRALGSPVILRMDRVVR